MTTHSGPNRFLVVATFAGLVLGLVSMPGFLEASPLDVSAALEAPRDEEIQAPRDEEIQAPRDQEIQAPRG